MRSGSVLKRAGKHSRWASFNAFRLSVLGGCRSQGKEMRRCMAHGRGLSRVNLVEAVLMGTDSRRQVGFFCSAMLNLSLT